MSNLTVVKNHKKLLSPLNSSPSVCLEYKVSSKLKHLPSMVHNFGLKTDRYQYWLATKITKIFVTTIFRVFDLCRVSNFIKTEALATFAQNYGLKDDRCQYWQLPYWTGVKNRKKTIATIEFITLNFCKVRNVIKIEAFAVLVPKLWPKNWQVPTLTGINIDMRQKLQNDFVTIEFRASDLYRVSNFIKTEALATFVQNYGLKDARCQYWQVSNKFDQGQESQITIVTIEFTTLYLCRVRNFIKVKAFVVLHPKQWPKRWQVPTLTGVKNHR